MDKWFYFNGKKFIFTKEIRFDTKVCNWIIPEYFRGKLLFHALTTRKGGKDYGQLYLSLPKGLIRLELSYNVEEIASFIQLHKDLRREHLFSLNI